MKNVLIAILFFASIISCRDESAHRDTEGAHIEYVTIWPEVVLRKGPTATSASMARIPFLAPVVVKRSSEQTDFFFGLTGYWKLVRYQDLEGWVFGPLLAPEKPVQKIIILDGFPVFESEYSEIQRQAQNTPTVIAEIRQSPAATVRFLCPAGTNSGNRADCGHIDLRQVDESLQVDLSLSGFFGAHDTWSVSGNSKSLSADGEIAAVCTSHTNRYDCDSMTPEQRAEKEEYCSGIFSSQCSIKILHVWREGPQLMGRFRW